MNLQAIPFDLRLWTGVADSPLADEEVYTRFIVRRDRVYDLNRRLAEHPMFHDCLLRIPLTERLFTTLCDIPPWSEIKPGSILHRFKRDVLALLRNRQDAAGITLYLDIYNAEHFYTWEQPAHFFPSALAQMQTDWVEMLGVCAFESTWLTVWIVTPDPAHTNAQLTRCALDRTFAGEQWLPLHSQTDVWAWERRVRQSLWQDERLPFNGPSGPFGYHPPAEWRPGMRPRRHQNAYLDALGGLWEWESGRAVNEQNPFGGHWNVQLPDASVRRHWATYLQKRSGKRVQTPTDKLTHINVEPDGDITDMTFAWGN